MACKEGAVARVIYISAEPRTLIQPQIRTHAIQILAIPIACQVISNSPPAFHKELSCLGLAPIGQAKVIGGVGVEEATQTTCGVVEDRGEGHVEMAMAGVADFD